MQKAISSFPPSNPFFSLFSQLSRHASPSPQSSSTTSPSSSPSTNKPSIHPVPHSQRGMKRAHLPGHRFGNLLLAITRSLAHTNSFATRRKSTERTPRNRRHRRPQLHLPPPPISDTEHSFSFPSLSVASCKPSTNSRSPHTRGKNRADSGAAERIEREGRLRTSVCYVRLRMRLKEERRRRREGEADLHSFASLHSRPPRIACPYPRW